MYAIIWHPQVRANEGGEGGMIAMLTSVSVVAPGYIVNLGVKKLVQSWLSIAQ